ncbi:hypothetical protein J2S44_006014 [Catenuloplanes niger]|uniref:Uncharacterized protein n=1 Tax=Catenuloplanes niger TaxID=587534 RepID=A0AAE3ZV75_9ACTN|nr:hypothetical protein [Catenuloplanes niger]
MSGSGSPNHRDTTKPKMRICPLPAAPVPHAPAGTGRRRRSSLHDPKPHDQPPPAPPRHRTPPRHATASRTPSHRALTSTRHLDGLPQHISPRCATSGTHAHRAPAPPTATSSPQRSASDNAPTARHFDTPAHRPPLRRESQQAPLPPRATFGTPTPERAAPPRAARGTPPITGRFHSLLPARHQRAPLPRAPLARHPQHTPRPARCPAARRLRATPAHTPTGSLSGCAPLAARHLHRAPLAARHLHRAPLPARHLHRAPLPARHLHRTPLPAHTTG